MSRTSPCLWRLCLLLAALSPTVAIAVTCTSIAAGGDWNVPATWAADANCATGNGTTVGTPGSNDTAIISTTGVGLVTLTGAETVGNLTMNHDVAANTALSFTGGSLTVSTLLTLTSGVISTGTFNLTVSGDCTTSITRTAGWISGNLRLTFPAGAATCTYPIGTSSSYAPASITTTAASAGGSLTATVATDDHAEVTRGVAGINGNKSVNLNWTLTSVSLATGTAYTSVFGYTAANTDAAATATSMILRKRLAGTATNTNGTWQTVSGTATATDFTAASQTSFGSFGVGEALPTANKAPFAHFRERF